MESDMQVTVVSADGSEGCVVRDATPEEVAAMQVVFAERIGEDQSAAIAEDRMRSAMTALQQAEPTLAPLLYNVIAAAGLNTYLPSG